MPDNQSTRTLKSTGVDQKVHEIQQRIARAAERTGRPPSEVTLIAVTKTISTGGIQEVFEAGVRHLGESRVQEARDKIGQLSSLQPSPTWHMVGHLQTNKAKQAVELFDLIHSVDSIRVAQAISDHAVRDIDVLVQVNIAGEDSKSGFSPADISRAIGQISRLPHLNITGLMTIAPYTPNPENIRPVFRQLRTLRDSLGLEHLSMGMTDDFEVAIEEGATMVRIGRAIFGNREDSR